MATHTTPMETAIRSAVEVRIRAIAQEETAAACERVDQRIRADLAKLVLEIHKLYRVEFHQQEIIIRVENKT